MNFEKNDNFNYKSSIVFILLGIALTILLFSSIKSIVSGEKTMQKGIYSEILAYSIPGINLSIDKKDEGGESLLKQSMLSLLGIDDNYLSIVGREISYIDTKTYNNSSLNEIAQDIESEDVHNKFSLNEDQVYEEENISSGEGDMNAAPVFTPELIKQLPAKPEVLIYHTHTCESYKPYGNNSKEMDKNITVVGEELKKELEKYGVSVIHDTTIHDIESYDDSYERSRVTLDKYLKQYKDFKLIIDLHRDSVENKDAVTTTINGESVARFSFVMTKKNPFYDNQIKVVEKIRSISNKLYPGNENINSFNKSTFYYNYGKKYYNQDASRNTILMELGSHVNTMEESKASTKYIARIIGEYINGKN